MLDKKLFGYADTSFCDMKGEYALALYFTGCNFDCPYCFNKHLNTDMPTFSVNDIENRYKELFNVFPNIGIVLSGGEPTYSSCFVEVCQYFKEKHKLGLHTNGYLLPFSQNIFDTVIIGIKSRMDGVGDFDTYKQKLVEACKLYSSAKKKELRLVDIKKAKNDYAEVLEFLARHGVLSGFEVNYVPKV